MFQLLAETETTMVAQSISIQMRVQVVQALGPPVLEQVVEILPKSNLALMEQSFLHQFGMTTLRQMVASIRQVTELFPIPIR